MPEMIANSVFQADGKEYRPGDTVPVQISNLENLMKKGFVVWNGGEAAEKEVAEQAAREAAEKEAAEQAAREAAEKEAAEQAAREAAEEKEKPVRGRKAKVTE